MESYLRFNSLIGDCSISCYGSQLCINQSVINFEYDITDIAISKNKIFVLYTKCDCSFEELPRNNISAYDFKGNYLFDVGKYIQDKWPYSTINIHNKITIHKEMEIESLPIIENHEYLVCYTYGELRFIVDITDERLVQKVSGRFK